MGYNYSREKRKFDAEWKKKEAWCSGGDLSVTTLSFAGLPFFLTAIPAAEAKSFPDFSLRHSLTF